MRQQPATTAREAVLYLSVIIASLTVLFFYEKRPNEKWSVLRSVAEQNAERAREAAVSRNYGPKAANTG